MKKNILLAISAIAAISFCATSCDDVLNIDPSDRYSEATIWSSSTTADQYLLGLYDALRSNSGNVGTDQCHTSFHDAYSDLIKSNSWNQFNHSFNTAFLQRDAFNSANAGCFENWSHSYQMIRRCNEFLEGAEKFGPQISDTYYQTRSGEARFIRSIFYLKLMRVYGKCIIRDAVDGPEQNDKPMASPDEVWDFIKADLEYAGQNIALSQPRGRITRAAAWAMLTRTALYNEDWDTVIAAADSCKKYGGKLDDSYENVFADINSPENLLTIEFVTLNYSHYGDDYFRPVGDSPAHNNYAIKGAFGPTSELVDQYEMADGTPFSWTTHGDDPYTGREPRFYASILYNGAPWEKRTIETYEGGADGILPFNTSGAAGATVTGYYLRKWITEGQKGWEKTGSDHFAIFIRYAEVLLNKAEAYAGKGDYANAYATLNEVRSRVGLPDKSGDASTWMDDIVHEKAVEMAGEGIRFWDLRRWRIAYDENDESKSVIDGKNFHGCKITKNEDGSFTYKQIVVDGTGTDGADLVHFFPKRYYAFAIPEDEISNNEAVTVDDQNDLW